MKPHKKIFLIGNVTSANRQEVELSYINTQLALEHNGFIVYNPCKQYAKSEQVVGDIQTTILRNLLYCDAVYVMPDLNIQQSLELRLAFRLNKTVISGSFQM